MLLLTRGCIFITHALQRQWKPLTNPFYFRFLKDKGEEILSLKGIEHIRKKLNISLCLPLCLSLPLFLPLPVSPDSCHSLHTMDKDYYEGTDYLSPVPADGERTEEFEYEVGNVLDITAFLNLTNSLALVILLAKCNSRWCIATLGFFRKTPVSIKFFNDISCVDYWLFLLFKLNRSR